MNSSLILFLNKRDLYEQKIKSKNIKDFAAFSDFRGPIKDPDAGKKNLKKTLKKLHKNFRKTFFFLKFKLKKYFLLKSF